MASATARFWLRPEAAVLGAGVAVSTLMWLAGPAIAAPQGITTYSGNPDSGAGETCTSCHTSAVEAPTITIDAPDSVKGGEPVAISVTLAGGPGVVAGFNASISRLAGELIADDIEVYELDGEVTHTGPKPFSQGSATFTFQWTPPVQPDQLTIYAAGVSANDSQGNQGDGVGATSKVVGVTVGDVAGDVDCGGTVDMTDAVMIAQHTARIRSDGGACPLADAQVELAAARGDVDGDQRVTIVDALLIAQCDVGMSNRACPASEPTAS